MFSGVTARAIGEEEGEARMGDTVELMAGGMIMTQDVWVAVVVDDGDESDGSN